MYISIYVVYNAPTVGGVWMCTVADSTAQRGRRQKPHSQRETQNIRIITPIGSYRTVDIPCCVDGHMASGSRAAWF